MRLLDILIPSIPSRKEQLNALRSEILKQIKDCETQWGFKLGFAVISHTNQPFIESGITIGEARQKLLDTSSAEYLCFLDDDDNIAPNYVSLIYSAIENRLPGAPPKPDVVTFWQVATFDNMTCIVDMSLQHTENEPVHINGITKRMVWHINPIKSSIAKQSSFPADNYGEDWSYMEKLIPLIKTEKHYNTVLHYYKHSAKTSEADKIANNV